MQTNATLAFLNRTRRTAALLFGCLLGVSAVQAQQPAFPGAEGAGRFASGGRGTSSTLTTVFAVTNLNDNGAGSLRAALEASQASAPYRTIVFRVAGTIHLNSPLSIKSNVTLAGQTAPGGGICIADQPVLIAGNNVIVRHLRFRLGDKNSAANNGNDDALGTNGNSYKNVIIDHCSVSWSADEALSIYSGDSTTLQWNFITEPLNYSYHNEGSGVENHGYGGIQGGKKMSVHHNLYAHCYSRTPRFDGVRNLSPNTPGLENVDFVNNVIYNWGTNNVYGGEGGNYNIVNNYYKYGPSTNSGVKFRVANPYKQNSGPAIPYGKYYINGNYVDGSTTNSANNWRGVTMDGGTAADTTLAKVTTPFSIVPVTTQDAASAYSLVLQQAGATLPARDTLDQRIVNDVMNRTGRIIDVQGGYPHNTPYATTTGAWPGLSSGTAPTDTDGDGMPDSYENANGLNAASAADRGVVAANGYTNLENYLNSITTAPSFSVSGNLTGFAQTVGSASAFKTFNLSGTNLTSDVTVTAPANFQVSANASTWSGTATIPVSNGNLSTSTVYVRMNAAAAGSYSGTIASTTSSITQNISVDGIAVAAPAGVSVTVAKDGTGNYSTVQAAIDAYPTGAGAPTAATPYVIYIRNGRYREKIVIPSGKPFIQLVGESVANVILYYDDPATVLGTSGSASLTVNATDFSAMNITFANFFGDGSQAVAVLVNNDKAAFKNCRFLGNQDTLYLKGAGNPRAYFNKCYIDGNVDFIFGSAIALFDSCTIFPKARTASGNSFITAANTPTGQNYGLVFRNTRIADNAATTYYLGRPWQNTTTASPLVLNNRTTFLNSTMGYSISPEGWTTWDATTNTAGIDYGEYASKDFTGAAVNTASRVSWSQQLSAAQAAGYTNAALFGTWDPCAVTAQMCTYQASPIAVSNFRGSKGASTASIDWNISWNQPGITYELYRSTTRNGGYSVIDTRVNPNDTLYYFQYTDALPTSGTAYYYYLIASKPGFASHTTDTVTISNVQTINVVGALTPFTQNIGTPSAVQSVSVSAANLTDDLIITPPANYEVSDNGATWFNSSNPLVLTATSGAIAATPISVRLNSPSLGTWSGDVVLSSPGATSVNVPVTGTTAIIAPVTEQVLQWWPMTQNNTDSSNVRSVAVAPSTTRFGKLVPSNGTTVAVVPPYSVQRGQALSATPGGDGLWSTAGGGPGGNLNRTFYEQFVVKPRTINDSLVIDSLIITSAFYNSSSSTKLGIVWSKSGFASDSANVSTNPGPFTNPILLNNQTSGPTDVYRLAFNGTTGVTIGPRDSLTFRIYFSCSSSTAGRYALVKDAIVKGVPFDLSVAPPEITVNPTSLPAFTQTLGLPSAPRSYTVSGRNLTSPLLVLPPANYEVSLDGNNWFNSVTPIVLQPVSGTVATTTVQVRLNAGSVGSYAGNVQNTIASGTIANLAVSGNTAAIPTIVTTSSMGPFSQTLGSPSATQTYTVRGLNLTTDLTITPPADYEISADGGTTWFTSSSPLTLTPVSGSVASTTITVRLNAPVSGSYSGNIGHLSSGATSVNVPVTGITSGTPTLISNGTLNPFSQTVGTPSAVQTYTISGSALSGTVTVTPPAGFEVSSDGGATWFNSTTPLTLTPSAGTLATTTISVRLNAATAGTYGGNITHASTGATSVDVAVNGTAVLPPSVTVAAALMPFSQTVGTPSAVQTYTISGANLVSNVTIVPPAGYEISADGGTNWFSSTSSPALTLAPASGTIATTTISVRLNAATAGTFNGNIVNTGSGFTTVNVPVTGVAVLPPTVTVSAALNSFAQTIGTPSATQSYTLSGQNLTAPVTITAPAGYQISIDGGSTWATTATVTPAAGIIAPVTVSVRLNAATPGNYGGSISNASTGAATRNVTLSGTAVAPPSLTVTGTPLQPFLQQLGQPSAVQTYVLTGSSLVGNTTVTPPTGYQISIDTGRTWSFQPIVINGTGGVVLVSVRLNAGTVGIYNGTITHATAGTAVLNVAVTGSTSGTANRAYALYPVPAYSQIYFVHPSDHRAATITIYGTGGQRIKTIAATIGSAETVIRLWDLPQGMYLAVYDDGSQRITQQFIKK